MKLKTIVENHPLKSKKGNKYLYTGTLLNGKPQSIGIQVFQGGEFDTQRYEGEWENGVKQGKGVYIWSDDEYYEGEWRNDERDGQGIYTWSDGRRYQGEWKDDMMHGQGVMTYADGSTRKGRWKKNQEVGGWDGWYIILLIIAVLWLIELA